MKGKTGHCCANISIRLTSSQGTMGAHGVRGITNPLKLKDPNIYERATLYSSENGQKKRQNLGQN